MSRNYLKHAPGLSVPAYCPSALAPRILATTSAANAAARGTMPATQPTGCPWRLGGQSRPSGTISGPAHTARGTLIGGNFERGPSWGELRRIRAHTIKAAHLLARRGGSAQRGDAHYTTSTFPFSTKPALTLPKKALRVKDFVEFRGLL